MRYVIGQRFDAAGMRWITERSEALLQLRCIEINEQWDDFIRFVESGARRLVDGGVRLVAIDYLSIGDEGAHRVLLGNGVVPLEGLDSAPAFERQRWSATLARAVLTAYRLDLSADHFYKYVPRRILVRHGQ